MITIEQLLRAREVLQSANVPIPERAFMNEAIARSFCQSAGVPYEPTPIGTLVFGDLIIYVAELQT